MVDLKKLCKEFIGYFGVGLIAAIVNIGSLYILSSLFHMNYIISNVIAFMLGLMVNYSLSKMFVFKDKTMNRTLEFIIYGLIGVLGLAIDTAVLWFLTEKIAIYYMISKIISTGVTFVWNFLARKGLYFLIEKKKAFSSEK